MDSLGMGGWRLLGLVSEALVSVIVYLLGEELETGGCENLYGTRMSYRVLETFKGILPNANKH